MMLFRCFRRFGVGVAVLAPCMFVACAAGAEPPAAAPAAPGGTVARSAGLHVRATSTTALTVASATTGNGSAVTLVATVDGRSNVVPGGSVEFTVHGKRIGEAPVANGSASMTVGALPAGLSSLSASYKGDDNFLPSTSATVRFYNDAQD